jgi:aryl-alcohol dehydrogenase-like predicted oxidoreductase
MERGNIGSLSVSRIGLGCNNFGRQLDHSDGERVVRAALDAGIDFFDTADVYGGGQSEAILGTALRDLRERVVIATKFGAPGSADEGFARGSQRWIELAVERSLERLGTDYIDLYQMHFPDPDVEIEETLTALDALVRSGKVREIGCSNFGSSRMREAAQVSTESGGAAFRTVQNRYSVLHREPEPKVIPACRELAIGLIPFFPLESGLLTGKYRAGEALPPGTRLAAMPDAQRARFITNDRIDQVERLRGYAEARGHSLLDLAMSWLTTNPSVVSVIAGATRPEQIKENTAAAGWALTSGERSEIDALLESR